MKYKVTIYDMNENEYSEEINVRGDAKIKTIYQRAVDKIAPVAIEKGILKNNITIQAEYPNIWLNGAVGSLWMKDDQGNFCDVHIRRYDGCVIAC